MTFLPLGPEDHGWVMALNAAHEGETSPLDRLGLAGRLASASHAHSVDRVVVSPAARGRGVGVALYRDVAQAAGRFGLHTLVAEVNLAPPNPVSLAVHARLHPAPVGEAVIDAAGGTLRDLRHELA